MQQKPNYKAMIVKYIINVLAFAVIYAGLSILMMTLGITGFLANVVPIAAAVLGLTAIMKAVGPWIDSRMAGK